MSQKYEIRPQKYGFSSNIGGLLIKTISWKDFPAKPPQNTWFLAYTYWNTNYTINKKNGKFKVVATVSIGPKAWTRAKEDFRLLQHQTGHYWIACLCALQFMKRVNYIQQQPNDIPFLQYCHKVFKKTSSQFSLQQKRYDKQTYHYLNQQDQDRWQLEMVAKFKQYQRFFQEKQKQEEIIEDKLKIKIKQNLIRNQKNKNIKSLPTQKAGINQNKTNLINMNTNQIKKKKQFSIRKQINNNKVILPNSININIGIFDRAKNTIMNNIDLLQKMK